MSILKNKPKYHFDFGNESVGGFSVDFYMKEGSLKDCYLHITTKSGIFEMKLQGYTYGYLMESARQGLTENIHGFCAMLFLIADGVYQDAGLANDLMKVIGKYQKRLFKRAEAEAKAVTDVQEQGAQAFMEDVAAYADATPKERKKMREEWKDEARAALNEKDNGE